MKVLKIQEFVARFLEIPMAAGRLNGSRHRSASCKVQFGNGGSVMKRWDFKVYCVDEAKEGSYDDSQVFGFDS